MIVHCPACGFKGKIKEPTGSKETRRIVCPSCGKRFAVGWTVLPPEGGSLEGRVPVSDAVSTDTAAKTSPSSRGPKRRRPFLWGCLIAFGVLAAAVVALIVIRGISGQLQESKEYDVLKKLGEKYPGYLILTTIRTGPEGMTEVQIDSYEEGLVGRGCVGMGRVEEIEKTTGSAVLDYFGLNSPGTIISMTYKDYDIELILKESYSDEFITYQVGDTVLFAGTIKKASIAGSFIQGTPAEKIIGVLRGTGVKAVRTRITLIDVIIEGHRKMNQ